MDVKNPSFKKESPDELKDRLKKYGVVLVPISKLKPHEQVSDEDMSSLKKSLLDEDKGILKFPIVCDKKYNLIVDGHNRYNIFKRLHLKKIPVYYVDYFDEKIVVDHWRKGETVTKKDVVEIIKKGKTFPPKTTKHEYRLNGKCVRILDILPQINVPLEALKNNGGISESK